MVVHSVRESLSSWREVLGDVQLTPPAIGIFFCKMTIYSDIFEKIEKGLKTCTFGMQITLGVAKISAPA